MNLNDIQESFKQLQNEYNNQLDRLSDLAKEEMKKKLSFIFENSPEDSIQEIYWVQYTPSFNDGDACEFTVCDVDWEIGDATWQTNTPADKALDEFTDFVSNNEGIMECIFGDNVKITIYRENPTDFVETDYYD